MRHFIRYAFLSISCLTAMSFSTSSFAYSDDEITRLLMSLNNHIVNLEKRVSQLEKQLKTPSKTIPVGVAQWRKLQTGMSMNSVKALLGEPLKISGGDLTKYYYSKDSYHSYVRFWKGSVDSWKEPD